MKSKPNKVMVIIGIFLMLAGALFFYWYEFLGGREKMHYDSVVVLLQEVKEGEVITDENLGYLSIDKELIFDTTITDPSLIVGKAARHYIAPYQKLHANYFDAVELILDKGQYIAPIPMDWVLTVPSTLRRGDEIIIYAATKVEEDTSYSVTSDDATVEGTEEESESGPLLPVSDSELLELFTTTVAYAKDGGNQEVVTTSNFDRLNGSSSIASLELILTTEEFKEIEQVIKEGGRLIIMYGKKD